MAKSVTAILSLLLAFGVVARGQQRPAVVLSDADKADMLESVLNLELRNQTSVPDFANIRAILSDNIEFIDPSRLSQHGFKGMTASQLRESKKDNVVTYLALREIFVRDGVAVVVLSRVTEGKPCFGAAFSRDRRYTYETRRTANGWSAQLISKPPPYDSGSALKRAAIARSAASIPFLFF